MFARSVSINLKPGTLPEFTKLMDGDVLSLLRKQRGFQGEITFCAPGGREVFTTSFWEQKENAEAYNTSGYPEVLKLVNKFIDGTPHVKNLEVVSSTYQKVAAHATA
jgi:heme-degrading monooxygenase HmoA